MLKCHLRCEIFEGLCALIVCSLRATAYIRQRRRRCRRRVFDSNIVCVWFFFTLVSVVAVGLVTFGRV